MYHFFVNQDQVGPETIRITGPDVNHIKNVLRMGAGEQVLISNGVDKDYLCEIVSVTSSEVEAKILSADEGGGELPAKLYLFQGLPKSDKMELIIQKAVELGVYQIIPVETKRAVVKLDKKKEESKLRRWLAVSESAAKQSKRLIIPEVSNVMTLREALAFAGEFDLRIIPFEHAKGMAETREILSGIRPGMRVGIFIGPEGGFEDSEVELAEHYGAKQITLGKRILRTETAGLAILSVLAFQLESLYG
ncbi:16S rRNA (uracil(1498)-N(3))-methyltransferase [Clostridium sp. Marseille-P2415]|uniref:16S rRNA (uracil(1498)-N(3))-methyltransferase n=1 Tax=Clostridium sp. Marseille-P2415 TaxID=1805471 RepID=UPI0009884D35|nr:16S rRNA (uracil(1498)-N(3))-methyltransferase [Clostridium sp. Marseille-P2415]